MMDDWEEELRAQELWEECWGRHALIFAVRYNQHCLDRRRNVRLVRMLIKAGADVNLKDGSGYTALMRAPSYGFDTEIMEMLIKAKADVNAKNDEGETVASMAAYYLNMEIRTLRQSKKCSREEMVRLSSDPTVLPEAKAGCRRMLKTLKKAGADLNYAFLFTVGYSPDYTCDPPYLPYPETLRTILAEGAKIDSTDELGRTALMIAQSEDVVQMLIEEGAKIEKVDNNGNNALYWALSRGNFGVADRLVKDRSDLLELEDSRWRLPICTMISHMRNLQKSR